jgi:hypothetical protein
MSASWSGVGFEETPRRFFCTQVIITTIGLDIAKNLLQWTAPLCDSSLTNDPMAVRCRERSSARSIFGSYLG